MGLWMTKDQLVQLTRLLEVKHTGNKDELLHRLEPIVRSVNGKSVFGLQLNTNPNPYPPSHSDTGTAVLGVDYPHIHWMMTETEIEMVNDRSRRFVIPHNIHAFCTYTEGLMKDRSACWRLVQMNRSG